VRGHFLRVGARVAALLGRREMRDIYHSVLQFVPVRAALTWGRDQFGTGEMWSCNSLTSWLLTRSGLDESRFRPAVRAPGWTPAPSSPEESSSVR